MYQPWTCGWERKGLGPGQDTGPLPGTWCGLWPPLPLFPAGSALLPLGGPESPEQQSLSSPAGPWPPSPHQLRHLWTPATSSTSRPQGAVSSCQGGPAHLPEQSLLAGAHPEGGRCLVAWKINRGPESPQVGPQPRQRPPFRQPWEQGRATSSPDRKGIQAGQTGRLSRGLGAQGPPCKGDRVLEAQRAAGGLQARPKQRPSE